MKEPWIERLGGIWPNGAETKDELVIEKYDPVYDTFTLVWQRATDGFFAQYMVKGNSDPQWELPFWGNIADQGIFGTQEEALSHILAIANDYHGNAPKA
ncbi:hypothetical protein LIN78_05930 [Leeia sp. TBRC 13508]|uniref:Uncharacterized protein n=1 Tax=Leeia speluncae TaxID=2884804 RepID=A0ABS8D4N9_9NEIS|nr:hypothetical protein [Leeia speluncae]MCB6183087.1 hypothetical protein [Leeia speluncae]